MPEKPKPDYRRIWDLERDLEISQGSERRPLRGWMVPMMNGRSEARAMDALLSEVDRALRVSGEKGFL